MKERKAFRKITVAGALLMLFCAGACGDTAPAPTFPPFPDPGPAPDKGTTEPDLVGLDGAGEAIDTSPTVTILGVKGLDEYPNLLCPNVQILSIQGQNLGGRTMDVSITANGLSKPIGVEGVPDPGDSDTMLFSVDFATFLAPDPENPPQGEMSLVDGMTFFIEVKCGTEDDLTLYPGLQDQMSFVMDAAAPILSLTSPSLEFQPAPLAGWLDVAGTLEDAYQVHSIEVEFEGAPVALLLVPAETTKDWSFEKVIDIRGLPSGLGTFTITGRDICGLPSVVEVSAKVIRWPQIRTHETYALPKAAGYINRILSADLNGDTFPDLLFATTKGLYISFNDSEAAFQGGDRFSQYVPLTPRGTTHAVLEDLDNDGDPDLVVVEVEQGKPVVSIYRNQEGLFAREEIISLGLKSGTKVMDLAVADLTANAFAAPDGAPRSDIMIVTNNQDEALVFFKRQNADQPQDFDQCADVFVPNAFPEGADAQGDPGGEIVVECPTLYAPPVIASGVDDITHMEVYDVTGINASSPDGYPEIIVGVKSVNQLNTFTNRFSVDGIADTAFTESTISYVNTAVEPKSSPRYFCLGNFIKTLDADDPIDLVVGTEDPAAWRVMQGGGPLGKFYNTNVGECGGETCLSAMKGTTGPGISGLTCGDFNLDGNWDFAITSNSSNLMQVYLGNGVGRFNQLKDSPLLNHANEAIAFVTAPNARRPQTVDLDQDSLPDFIVDHGDATYSIYMNISTAPTGFELRGTRALVNIRGKEKPTQGGMLQTMVIGDIGGDGKDEIVAVTQALKNPGGGGLLYHSNSDLGTGHVVYVWQVGENGANTPAYPAAHDFISAVGYGVEAHSPVKPSSIKLMDVGSFAGGPKDGVLDLVFVGDTTSGGSGVIASNVSVLVATHDGNFWHLDNLLSKHGSMFEPMEGGLRTCEKIGSFVFVNPEKVASRPALAMSVVQFMPNNESTAELKCDPPPFSRRLMVCPWEDKPAIGPPFWDCSKLPGVGVENKLGGPLMDVKRIAKVGPDAAGATEDPDTDANLVSIHDTTNSLTYFKYNGSKIEFPYEPAIEKAIGTSPQSIDFGDLDGDGVADFAVAIKENIYIAFGQSALEPFTAPKPIDLDAKFTGSKDVVITDVNFDGWMDVVFANKGSGKLIAYLNIGLEAEGMSKEHLFHGPFEWPICKTPSQLIAHAFDKNSPSCEDLVVLCETAGAIALFRNDGCF